MCEQQVIVRHNPTNNTTGIFFRTFICIDRGPGMRGGDVVGTQKKNNTRRKSKGTGPNRIVPTFFGLEEVRLVLALGVLVSVLPLLHVSRERDVRLLGVRRRVGRRHPDGGARDPGGAGTGRDAARRARERIAAAPPDHFRSAVRFTRAPRTPASRPACAGVTRGATGRSRNLGRDGVPLSRDRGKRAQ